MRAARASLPRAALYAGGFLGPFGGGVVASMLPEIGASTGVSAGAAASTLTAYLGPFALTMLVSGTLGARWGRVRTVRTAYIVYAVASLASALAPTLGLLLASRALQGVANAFTTPLLLAALAALVPRARLGRALGLFGAMQAAGQTSAPLVGGLAAEVDWRWAFVVIAAAAAVLTVIGLPEQLTAPTGEAPPRLRDALRPDVVRIGVVALLGWGALGGLNFLLAFRAEDVFGLTPTQRGLLLTGFGVAGILTARRVGTLIDRIGARRTVLLGALAGAGLVVVVGTAGLLWLVAAAWFVAGIASQCVLVGVNAAVLGSSGRNRGGAVSVVQAFRFSGGAVAPLALTPLYAAAPVASFVVPALVLAVVAPLAMPRRDSPSR
ncbi:MFS transporter [Rhodococcus sp. DMF-1]|uniref:MFS transporter n=1 Tax=Rhodococcus TaxID=1827 RepID=UPI0006602EB9|nr:MULTISPECIES: MFS transporter [Rhodococcus]MBP2211709.1 MFS family permease [Rhodococcus ruber]MCZ1073871.1 MFS transporter [Rhodococcus sp. A5(2022)]MDV3205746.1 MFS transporter [Rhodococcus ruber]UIR38407.1 MFS transporter [Rhodococcus sp. DMF-1]